MALAHEIRHEINLFSDPLHNKTTISHVPNSTCTSAHCSIQQLGNDPISYIDECDAKLVQKLREVWKEFVAPWEVIITLLLCLEILFAISVAIRVGKRIVIYESWNNIALIKGGQNSPIYKGWKPCKLSMVFTPDCSQLSFIKDKQKKMFTWQNYQLDCIPH